MISERAWNFAVQAVIVLGVLFALYCLTASIFFRKERAAVVRCPITLAATVVIKEDGESVAETSRVVIVNCDYAGAGVPKPNGLGRDIAYFEEGRIRRFNELANKRRKLTVGDAFTCTAIWLAYAELPLAKTWSGKPYTILKNCRVAISS